MSPATQPRRSSQVEAFGIDPLVDDRWDGLVLGHERHSLFHRAAWARVLHESYGHRPSYLECRVDSRTVALVPLMEVRSRLTGCRGVCLPFTDFCDPLWCDRNAAAGVREVLLEKARERGWRHLEIRGEGIAPLGTTPFRSYSGHILDLRPGIQAVERGLSASVRRAIRKAEREGLKVSIGRSAGDLSSFYRLHARTRRRHGLPPQPPRFFHSLGRHVIEPGCGEVVLARHRGRAVAGAVFLYSGGAAIYKFGASDARHWPLRPNHLVMWTAIRSLAQAGCHSLDFGRSDAGADGLLRFKRSWGGVDKSLDYQRYQLGRGRWICDHNRPAASHPILFGWMPISVNRVAGGLIYPHLD